MVDAGNFLRKMGDSDRISFIDSFDPTSDQAIVIEQCTRGQINNA